MDTPKLNEQIRAALSAVSAERSAAALEPGKMFDYIVFAGVRLYRPTLAHLWVFRALFAAPPWRSDTETVLLLGWALAHTSTEVRNVFYRDFVVDPDALCRRALEFFAGVESAPGSAVTAIETLLTDVIGDDTDTDEAQTSSLSMGWYANLVGKIAGAYSWTESAILALPLVRLRDYFSAIDVASGEPDDRSYPRVPSELILAELVEQRRQRSARASRAQG